MEREDSHNTKALLSTCEATEHEDSHSASQRNVRSGTTQLRNTAALLHAPPSTVLWSYKIPSKGSSETAICNNEASTNEA